ncbi:hypothetical protein IMSAGC008_01434 [Muribaculaceae bacterium]|jgi:hypothetical protein|nr:hypothetical protein IMSAGC008_01434 [Muribaculaceae bacterium]
MTHNNKKQEQHQMILPSFYDYEICYIANV